MPISKETAYLLERCTGIAEVIGFESRTGLMFFFLGFLFTTAKVVSITAMIFFLSNLPIYVTD